MASKKHYEAQGDLIEDEGRPQQKMRCTQRGLDYDESYRRHDVDLHSGISDDIVELFSLEAERRSTRRANVPSSHNSNSRQANVPASQNNHIRRANVPASNETARH